MLTPKTIHPTSRTLVSYLDGELPAEERREIAAHLHDCPGCRGELDCIEADLDWHLVLDAASLPRYAPPSADGLRQLLSATREWREKHPAMAGGAEGETQRGLEHPVGEAIELFFGAGAAQAFTDTTKDLAGSDKAETLLAAFLGQRAAVTLMGQIRNRAKIERFLAPELT